MLVECLSRYAITEIACRDQRLVSFLFLFPGLLEAILLVIQFFLTNEASDPFRLVPTKGPSLGCEFYGLKAKKEQSLQISILSISSLWKNFQVAVSLNMLNGTTSEFILAMVQLSKIQSRKSRNT